MEKLNRLLVAAFEGKPVVEGELNFAAEDVNEAAINALYEKLGLDKSASAREMRAVENTAFGLIEESIDEILPKKLENVLGEFAEVRSFSRDAEVVFNIEKVGKNRAKLTISKGARGGIYRAARLDRKYFNLETRVETVAVYCTLEEILLGTMSLGELFSNILEGFEEAIYKEVFNALAVGTPVAGYPRIKDGDAVVTTTKAALGQSLDVVLPYVKQYGIPTIFGSAVAMSELANPGDAYHPELEDSKDRRQIGIIRIYKGVRIVELPNYLVDSSNGEWFYDAKYVFVLPSGVKPVKVALKGEMYIKKNEQAVGSEKWEAHKLLGVGLAMANNFAVITVTDAVIA
jgi:hypothetical protein